MLTCNSIEMPSSGRSGRLPPHPIIVPGVADDTRQYGASNYLGRDTALLQFSFVGRRRLSAGSAVPAASVPFGRR